MKRNLIIGIVVVAILISGFFILRSSQDKVTDDIIVSVSNGSFIIDVVTTGELEAKVSQDILGPSRLREFRIYQIAIQDIIDEGTVVKEGDWIATLDKSEFNTKLQDQEIELEQEKSQFIQIQLDTTLQMRQARDELINLAYAVEEMEIRLEQSQFEPPATIKQAEIDLDKAKRALQQAQENYKIRLEQNKAKMSEISAEVKKEQREYDQMLSLEESFTVRAPDAGMVVYAKGHDRKPIKAGSSISPWNPVVATLPDLTVMLSKTYINEVDVRRIKEGQKVEIGLDAFPEKKLSGRVIRVANVGEQRPNSDSKVFEATVEIDGSDPLLRPAMTTSNRIIVKEIDDAMYIPLECLHTHNDTITFVYKKSGINVVKQEVQVGENNTNEAIILAGLDENDRLYLSIPGGQGNKDVALIPEMDGKRSPENTASAEKAAPEEKMTITLPDGTTRTVSKEQYERFMQRRRQPGNNNRGGQDANRGQKPNS
jgi:multidrug efflux pump subunit AcrA (membrane-fusion protein)